MWQRILAAGGILIAVSGTTTAAGANPCAAIAEPAARLACYDRLHAPQATPAPAEPAARPTVEPAAATAAIPAPAAVIETERFGAEALPARPSDPDVPDVPEAIESRISGLFKGWEKNSEFKLDNGQVWRCVNCRDVYYQVESPAVTVKRGFLGSYWLQVEGLNTRATVKRIK